MPVCMRFPARGGPGSRSAYESLPKGIQVEGRATPVSTGSEAEKEWRESAEGKKTKEKGCFVDAGVFPTGIDRNSEGEEAYL
ncbi:hypothetical protein EDD16DRAFT_1712601 [Pisolithus croceorrhizus]|nr:hypothetical protein EDD16DRAFT_1712601 [Pisolithus croceorrhizus]KAI6134422.1 hypothetical protein EV401DRAFT_2064149 [Pisolithus croceorrhizus]